MTLKLVVDNTKKHTGANLCKNVQAKHMSPTHLSIGDTIEDSANGPGVITDFTERGYPRVNHVAVCWLKRTDGVSWG